MYDTMNLQIYFRKYLGQFSFKINELDHSLYNHVRHTCVIKILAKEIRLGYSQII